MKPDTDLKDFLARAKEIAASSRIAKVASPIGQNQPVARADQGQNSRVPPAIPATPATPDQEWTPEDWRYLFHERAGFLEHDCHLSRLEAEQRTTHELEGQWMALHPPAASDPQNGCVQCRKRVGAADLLPRLAGNKSHLWLHQGCWPAYERARRTEARAALEKMIPDLLRRDALDELLDVPA